MPRILTEEQKQKKREYNKQYREHNRDKIKQYFQDNKQKLSQLNKNWRKTKGAIKIKLNGCKREDTKKSREFNIDEDYVKQLLEQQEYKCANCNVKMKMEWEDAFDKEQFSINRINNNIGHIKDNCNITCWYCNNDLEHQNQFKRGCIYKRTDNHNNCWVFEYIFNGKRPYKSFSIDKYGDKEAEQMAIDYQNQIFPLTSS
jgi:hypothetical protein